MATSWTYSDYVTYSHGSARLTRARLFLQELMDAKRLYQSQSADGGSTSRFQFDADIERVSQEIREQEDYLGEGLRGSRSPFSRGVPKE